MRNIVVVGSQWGDEGKGKIVDWLSEQADVVIRFQGGHNAGHTLVIDGVTYDSTAIYYIDNFTSIGCDSTTILDLTVLSSTDSTFSDTACNEYQFNNELLTTSGTYYDTLTSNFGCDSIIQTNLVVENLPISSDSVSICSGDSIVIGGSYQLNPDNYFDTLVSFSGCDSIVETQLFIDSVLFGTDSLTICFEDSVLIGGNYQTITGNYVDTLTSNAGCDSVLTTYLTVSPSLGSLDTMIICSLDSVFLSGNFQSTSGSYIDTLSSINGCDSIVETILQVDSILYGDEILEVCFGDSVCINGVYYSEAKTYCLQTLSFEEVETHFTYFKILRNGQICDVLDTKDID